MRCIACVLVLAWVAGGCAGGVEDGKAGEAPTAATPQPAKVAPPPKAARQPAKLVQPQPREPVQPTLSIVKLDTNRVAIDLHAESWPGRALDPVLTIGQLTLTEYEHPSKQVLRFVVSDASELVAGSEVVLQYGDDIKSRVVITQALELPR